MRQVIPRKRVVIAQRRLTHYRVPLFEMLRHELVNRGIVLDLLIGTAKEGEKSKNDAGFIPWATQIPTHYFMGGSLCWQPLHPYLSGADLVVVTQENALVVNHFLILMPHRYKLAFWGHGANLQSRNPHGFKERFKRWSTNQVDWWFAYTQLSAELVKQAGFSGERITVLNNAVDTSEMLKHKESVTAAEVRNMRASLGFGEGPVGIFVGSLYSDKRLDFLFAAAAAIRRKLLDFHLLIVGDGPERTKAQAYCEVNPWAKWVGARFGREKAVYLSGAQIILNPGLVGLGIVDSFVHGVPIMTTDCGIHSPEISYLEPEINGVITLNSLDSYVKAIVDLLTHPSELEKLRVGCFSSSKRYTLENMVHRFAKGIELALDGGGST